MAVQPFMDWIPIKKKSKNVTTDIDGAKTYWWKVTGMILDPINM